MADKFVPKKNTGLGKGLSALIPGAGLTREGTLSQQDGPSINDLPITSIRPNPFQPRQDFEPQALEELKSSIVENGIIQPVTVRKVGNGYELIVGERRYRAAKMAGLEFLPAYVRDGVSDAEMLELAIIENVQRETLNPIDLAQGYQQLIDVCRLTQEQVAAKIGKDRTTITNIIRLLKLPKPIQESLRKEEVTIGHGRALISLPTEDLQIKAWKEILTHFLSVRKTEQYVKTRLEELQKKSRNKTGDPGSSRFEIKSVSSEDPHVADVENRLRLKLGTKVRLRHRSEGGSIEIDYYSNDDLQRLLDLFDMIHES